MQSGRLVTSELLSDMYVSKLEVWLLSARAR